MKDYVKREFGPTALNALIEVVTYGPAVLAEPSKRHAFFFLTPFMFRHLSAAIVAHVRATGGRSSHFALQTQGLFNAALPGRPLLIYTDHTMPDALNDPDPRPADVSFENIPCATSAELYHAGRPDRWRRPAPCRSAR